ncbi:MAG: molecular chaperone HscC [Gammaproteobacteria bacterium]|nr:molecular chaperone HscC [Gammaproteobacteria bacterium]
MALIGIDLGTTHSLIAYYKDGKANLIPNVHGSFLTPSVVSVEKDGNILVGESARERFISHPDNSVHAFKRMMGTAREWQSGKRKFRPEELSALVLRSLKQDAENFLGEPVSEAVISVPAYFNDIQRNATKQAAAIAGLQVTRLINEPTAAALIYGLNDSEDDKKYLVLDLGGGTFDVTILEYFSGVFEVHASAGDNHLGGEDFTQVIIDWINQECVSKKLECPSNVMAYKLAEAAKKQLSKSSAVEIPVSDTDVLLFDQAQFEKIANSLINRIREPIIRVMQDTELTPADFNDIVLIGGSTRMPVIHQFVTKLFKRFPRQTENPDHVVALGAAIQAGLIARHEELNEVVMTDVMPYSMGIATHNESEPDNHIFTPIIERNQTVPVSKEERFSPITDKQSEVELKIYQGESRFAANNLYLGELSSPMPQDLKKRYVDVRFTYDVNGLLEVIATTGDGSHQRLVIQQTEGRMSDQEVDEAFKKLAELKIHPREKAVNKALTIRLDRLYEQAIGERREQIGEWISTFNKTLATQDEKRIAADVKALQKILDEIENRDWF